MTTYPLAPVQPPQCLPKRIRPLGPGVGLLTLALALGAAACDREATPGKGSMNGTGLQDVAAGVTDVTARGFTLTLQPGVRGITAEDVTLTPPVAIATATASDKSNTRYAVTTGAWLARGREYTLTIAKAGYRITSPSFTRSGTPTSEATITKMTLTVGGLAVEGSITGTNIRFPYGARSADGAALTGVVSLELPEGAAVDGENPHNTEKTYSTTPTNITVRAEDGTTTQTYTVATEAYHKDSNPYGVYTPAHLQEVRGWLQGSYRLMQAVTLPGAGSGCTAPAALPSDYCKRGLQPLGDDAAPFTGTFNGNGHRISNLFIRRSGAEAVGLFGAIAAPAHLYDLGIHMAPRGVHGGNYVGGLVGRLKGGRINSCYVTGTVLGGDYIGGLVGYMPAGSIANAYATGAVLGASYVGGLVGYMPAGSISNTYATGTVLGDASVGGLVGYYTAHSASVAHSYYPKGRPWGEGSAGTVLSSGAIRQATFTGFAFAEGTAAWEWADGVWPKLTGFQATQTTPGLTFHKATLSVTPVPDAEGFTLALTPPLSGLTKDDWALYDGATGAVPLTSVSAANDGASYAFEASLAMGTSYRLLYTKPDVIVLQETAGHMAIRVPGSADVVRMTLTTAAGFVVSGTITPGAESAAGTIVFYNAPKGSSASLTGVVSLALAKGAQVEGVSPQGKMETYNNTPKALKVQAEDGTTTKTYNISVAAYDEGTNPYGVYTPAQLHGVRDGLSDGYRLMQDVTLPNAGDGCIAPNPAQTNYCAAGWQPIGTFTGTFDGNGHAIKNLFIRRSGASNIGLFGSVGASGVIRNLGVHIAPAGVTGDAYVGGLVGGSAGTIVNCYATGAVTGSGSNVGGLVGESRGSIINCYATGAVSGDEFVGGLTGHSSGTIVNCYATGAASGRNYVGGLVGLAGSTITNCYAIGAVSGSGVRVGGLVGSSARAVTYAYAVGAVTGSSNVGGLVGYGGGSVTNAYATGAVTGSGSSVGGLVGSSARAVTNAYAVGAVTGSSNVGGLVGYGGSTITNCYATGAVTGSSSGVGGLVGLAGSTITNCYATGAVSGSGDRVGGLVGSSARAVTNAYATGAVSAYNSVGGLVGHSRGIIVNCYATGAVTGNVSVGGLVGPNYGTITNCYATGAVLGSSDNVGGLAGHSSGTITNAYATGAVSGYSHVGGLVGNASGSTITNAYATGAVNGRSAVGGLVGHKAAGGTITKCYYPLRRPTGAGGTPVNSGAKKTAFSDFTFQSDTTTASWKWVDGQWPQLTGIQATQTTPSRTFHTAAVTTPTTGEFTVTLVAPSDGLTKDDWALYEVTSTATSAVQLTGVTTTDDGNSYAFTANLTANTSYHLLYTKADVIVVPKTGDTGHIAVTVPASD